MGDLNSTAEQQNSTVERQIRPDTLMGELGIKKDTYYGYLKHLGIKAEKDSEGKAYLTEEQANLVGLLRSHVKDGGKIEEFAISSMVKAEEASLGDQAEPVQAQQAPGFDMEDLVRGAAELAGHRMTMGQQLMLQMAERMTYEDLPEEVRLKVDSVRQATNPKHQNLSELADQMLNQWRQQRQQQPEAAAAA